MANDYKPKPDRSSGLDALRSAMPGIEKRDYGKNPLPGNVKVPCKNKDCAAAVESGFVYNVAEWIEGFISTERTCPACHSKAVYSRDDIVPVS
jgi:hypothetical protein